MSRRIDRTPLARVRGLGSARSGTEHFWQQRLTAVANVPLTIGFVIILVSLLGRGHATAMQILGHPLVAILMLLFVVSVGLSHAARHAGDHRGLRPRRAAGRSPLLIANIFFAIAVARRRASSRSSSSRFGV